MACKSKKMKSLTKEDIDRIIEDTMSGAIGSRPMGFAGNKNDPAFAGRNADTKAKIAFVLKQLGVGRGVLN